MRGLLSSRVLLSVRATAYQKLCSVVYLRASINLQCNIILYVVGMGMNLIHGRDTTGEL